MKLLDLISKIGKILNGLSEEKEQYLVKDSFQFNFFR